MNCTAAIVSCSNPLILAAVSCAAAKLPIGMCREERFLAFYARLQRANTYRVLGKWLSSSEVLLSASG